MSKKAPYSMNKYLNKKVKVVFMDGKAIKGTLVHISQYEVFVKMEKEDGNARTVLIMKHAIKYIM